MGAEAQGDRAGADSDGVPERLQWNNPGLTSDVDFRVMEGRQQLSGRRGGFSSPNGRLHRRKIQPPSRP